MTTEQFFEEFAVDYPELAQCYFIYEEEPADEFTLIDDRY